MALSFNNNLGALRAIRGIADATANLSKSTERLSTGLRINSSVDDAAGLAVSESLRTNTRVRNRGLLNIGDGVSAFQIMDGAVGSINNLLTRMAELSQQGANGILTSSQRNALEKEYRQLDNEIRRIAKTTKFNGISLFEGGKASRGAEIIASNAAALSSVTGDGRYVHYYSSTAAALLQLDTETGQTTTIAAVSSAPTSVNSTNNGEVVSFVSTSNITGENAGGLSQLYVYNRTTGVVDMLSNSSASESITAAMSLDGSKITFLSKAQYNSDGSVSATTANYFLHVYDTATGIFSKFNTNLGAAGNTLNISSDGSYVGVTSRGNPFGTNADGGSELLMFKSADLNGTGRQVTTTAAGNYGTLRAITNDGRGIFTATTNLVGQNPGAYNQFYAYSYDAASFSQLTNIQSSYSVYNQGVSPDGTKLFITTNTSLTGEATNSQVQLFEFDLLSGTVTQRTSYNNNSVQLASTLSDDQLSGYYVSGGNLFKVNLSNLEQSVSISTGSGTQGKIDSYLSAIEGTVRGLGVHTLTSQIASRGALEAAKKNLEKLSLLQGNIGTGVSRLEVASRVTGSTIQEYQSARSRIIDIDVAEETAKLIRYQILQDASTAIFAQANQSPKLALALLG